MLTVDLSIHNNFMKPNSNVVIIVKCDDLFMIMIMKLFIVMILLVIFNCLKVIIILALFIYGFISLYKYALFMIQIKAFILLEINEIIRGSCIKKCLIKVVLCAFLMINFSI
jgi:hypothetical protein